MLRNVSSRLTILKTIVSSAVGQQNGLVTRNIVTKNQAALVQLVHQRKQWEQIRTFSSDSIPPLELLKKTEPLINDDVKKEISASLLFTISGNNYLVDVHPDRPLRIEKVTDEPKTDVKMITDEATFTKLFQGKANPTSAFMTGKLKIKGNLSIAMKVDKLMKLVKDQI